MAEMEKKASHVSRDVVERVLEEAFKDFKGLTLQRAVGEQSKYGRQSSQRQMETPFTYFPPKNICINYLVILDYCYHVATLPTPHPCLRSDFRVMGRLGNCKLSTKPPALLSYTLHP